VIFFENRVLAPALESPKLKLILVAPFVLMMQSFSFSPKLTNEFQ
jgi:hypothetical protein